MPPVREISGKWFLKDMRSGMSDHELMDKYRLTEKGLAGVFDKLLELKAITLSELQARSPFYDEPFIPGEFRVTPREDLDFPLPVYDKATPRIKGLVHDITENGVGVRGIPTRVDQLRTFVIPVHEFFRSEPVVFQAKCRWVKEDDDARRFAAGFEFVTVLAGSMEELRSLIRALTLEDRQALRRKT